MLHSYNTENSWRETTAARVFSHPHLGISQFCLPPRNGEKTTCTRANWRNGRRRNFIRSRSYAPIAIVAPRKSAAAAIPREYINFASTENCRSPLESDPTSRSFLPRYFVPSVIKMNKVYSVSSDGRTNERASEFRLVPGALIKMTRLVRLCQFFLALPSPADRRPRGQEPAMVERRECQVARGVLKFRYGCSAAPFPAF